MNYSVILHSKNKEHDRELRFENFEAAEKSFIDLARMTITEIYLENFTLSLSRLSDNYPMFTIVRTY